MNASEPRDMRLLVADDHQLMRDAIGQLLMREYPQATLVMASTYLDTIEQLGKNRIQLLLLDLRMPGMRGLESVQQIVAVAREVPVVVWTGMETPEMTGRLVQAGVFAVLSKADSADLLLGAVRQALGSRIEALNPPSSKNLPHPYFHNSGNQKSILTQRQFEILRCLHDGMPNKLIARELDITLDTVKSHINAMLIRLEATNRSQLLGKTKEWLL